MTTPNAPLTAREDRTNKTTVFFTALALAALMVSAAGGGAAFMIYREFSSMPDGTQSSTSRGPQTVRLTKLSAPASRDDAAPRTRAVAAESSDQSDYRYADNTVLPPAAARRVIAAWTSNPLLPKVPAPLAEPAANVATDVAANADDRPPLTDSGSHYIISRFTGQVIGVDGSTGAAAEAQRAPAVPVRAAIPVPVAVQMPPPEVRVASAIPVRAAIPVGPDDNDVNNVQDPAAGDSAQYVPVRRALPVTTGRAFDASNYLANQDDSAVPGARAANPTSRSAGYRHDFRLPEQGN